jgi:hypothetical protein
MSTPIPDDTNVSSVLLVFANFTFQFTSFGKPFVVMCAATARSVIA